MGLGHVRLAEFKARYLDFAPHEMRSHCYVSARSNLCFCYSLSLLRANGLQRCPGGKNKVHETAAVIQESIPEAWTRMVVMEVKEMEVNDHNRGRVTIAMKRGMNECLERTREQGKKRDGTSF